MPDKTSGRPSNLNGFTLIEIFIVLLIIGILSSVAVVSFGDFGGTRRVIVFAEDSLSYLQAMQRQALIESIPFGIHITPTSFQTYRLNEELHWHATSSHLFRAPHFPSNITVKLQSNLKNTAKYPGIVIDNSGEITSFQLKLGTSRNPELVTIISDPKGGLRLCKSASL